MLNLLLQLQVLLGALTALLPLAPDASRARAAEILDMAARALAVGVGAAASLDDLAHKLAAVRAEVEAAAERGGTLTAAELDAAMNRVRTASLAFRTALETAEAGA